MRPKPRVRILIADDNDPVRQGIRSLLDCAGWEICGEAVDGPDATEKCRQLKPEIVLLDVSLPKINGLEVARIVRREVPGTSIIMVSQHDATYMVEEALEAGARGYVVKSELSHQLLPTIEAVLTAGPAELETKLKDLAFRADAERRLADEASARLAAIVQSSDDAIISKDLNGVITSWNASAERIFGYTEAEALGRHITLIIPPELHAQEAETLRRLRAGERIDHFETVRVAKGGSRVRVALTISPVKNSSGEIIGASKVSRDITKMKQVEEALRQSEQRMRFSLEAANFGTWDWDIHGGAVHWSENMEKIQGQAAGSFGGNFDSFLDHIYSEDQTQVKYAIQQALASDGKYHVEYRQTRADGTLGWMEARGQVIYDDANLPSRMMGVCMDISERKTSEEALKQARAHLEARVKERTFELERAQERLRTLSGQLLRMQDDERRRIARELHDTVGQIVIALSLNLVPVEAALLKDNASLAQRVTDSLGLLEELSRDLRTISHLLHPPLLDEAGLQSAVRWYVQGFSERSKIEVDLELSPDLGRLPAELETAIFRIVQECFTNIHRHSGSSTASIRIIRGSQNVEVEIRDQGKGMPVPAPRAGVGIQGMGERVRQWGGKLEIESGGAGTLVRATFPLGAAASPEAMKQPFAIAS
jgi:PAS domain S-box-containing protein